MAGLDNLKGRRAVPFGKGGKRRKAKRALARMKGADLSNVDLAFRFRHGWIPIGKGNTKDTGDAPAWKQMADNAAGARAAQVAKAKSAAKAADTAEAQAEKAYWAATHKHGPKSKQSAKALLAWKAETEKNGGPVTQYDADVANNHPTAENWGLTNEVKIQNAATMFGTGSKQHIQAMRKFGGQHAPTLKRGRDFSTPAKGEDIDLDWGSWNAKRKGGGPTLVQPRRPAPHPAAFKPAPKAPGSEQTKFSAGAIAKRASQPGHFRAKAILAASQGNMVAARRFEAKRAVAKAARLPAKPAVFKQPSAPKPAAPAAMHPAAPRPQKPVVVAPLPPRVAAPVKVRKPKAPRPFKPTFSGQAR